MRKYILSFTLSFIITGTAVALDSDMARFAGSKKAQAREFAGEQTNKVPSIVWSFFDAVRVDDWETATNLGAKLQRLSGRYVDRAKDALPESLNTALWQPISETIGAYGQFHDWDNHWLHRFGGDIIDSIPKGSIYFGGTDPGRFIISALCENQREGIPFFVVTQNQLADMAYLDYLRAMYRGKIYTPTTNDSQTAFGDYMTDAAKRLQAGMLKPGENVQTNADGRVSVSGQVAVMEINGLLAKYIWKNNPDRHIYIEESFPLDWMYPYLSPHGLIMELHHDELARLDEETLRKDHEYWNKLMGELVGDWLTENTSVSEICNFNEDVHVGKNLEKFKGNVAFARNKEAQLCFSKLRCSIAGLYTWRMKQASDSAGKDRMRKEADLAFEQSLVCYPAMPEAVYGYVQFLIDLKRFDDAKLVVKTAMHANPENEFFKSLLSELQKY